MITPPPQTPITPHFLRCDTITSAERKEDAVGRVTWRVPHLGRVAAAFGSEAAMSPTDRGKSVILHRNISPEPALSVCDLNQLTE